MKKINFLLFFVFTTNILLAQKQGNQWYFGTNAALDFNTGVPVPVLTSAMSTGEGCASIADKTTGQLLFYSDGSFIWDNTNTMMPATLGGTILLGGNSSSTQSAVIVPKPGSTTLYYLFTVGAEVGFAGGNPGVGYSIVDMS